MPFPFTLPTTSHVSFPDFFSSSTHPSLIVAATSSRSVLRDALKKHKRIPPQSQASNLPRVLDALSDYIPFLFAFDSGLNRTPIVGTVIDVTLVKELEVSWRSTLATAIPGREPPRAKLRGLESELSFVLWTLASTHCLLARNQLHTLYHATSPTAEQRGTAIGTAMKHFLTANSIHNYLVARNNQLTAAPGAVDISQAVLSSLASLTLAEATQIAVLKDDPYPAVAAEDRSKDNKDWMFKAPAIPKVRAHLFARICLAAADHAARGQASVGRESGVDGALAKYLDDLRRMARGKACRFLAIDADIEGSTGEGIAWLRAAKKEMGFAVVGEDDEKKVGKLSKLKKDWAEKREDRKVEKGVDWGSDAGKFEEGRIVDMLERKWVKMNDTMNVQRIPPSEPLLARLPSGREYHTPAPYIPLALDGDVLDRMRASPDPCDRGFDGKEEDSDDRGSDPEPVGAFPGTKSEYSGGSSYY